MRSRTCLSRVAGLIRLNAAFIVIVGRLRMRGLTVRVIDAQIHVTTAADHASEHTG